MKFQTDCVFTHHSIVFVLVVLGSFAATTNAISGCGTELPTVELVNYNATEFNALDAIVDAAELVNFGESSHGLTGIHLAATRMFRYLVEAKGFRVLIFESAWGVDEAMQTFLSSNRTTFTSEERFFLNAFFSPQTLELLLWIREFNRLNTDDPIRLGGYQPEQPVTDLAALWTMMAKSDKFIASDFEVKFGKCKAVQSKYPTDLDFIVYIGQLRRNGQPSYTAQELADCNRSLNETGEFMAENREELIAKNSLSTFLEGEGHLLSFRAFLNVFSVNVDKVILNKNISEAEAFEIGRIIYQEGDKARTEIFQILYKTRYEGKRTMFWMHNWHAMKNSPLVSYSDNIPKGTISLGTRFAQTYSATQYVVIGNVVACPKCKKPMRDDAHEVRFAAVLERGSSIVNIRHPSEQHQQLPLNTSGSLLVQSDETYLFDVVLDQQFDAIYYLSESTLLSEQ